MSDQLITKAVHKILLASKSPLHRGDIVRRLRIDLPYLQRCSLSTVERRTKEAINVLIRSGVPVVSDGEKGFRISTDKREVEEAANRLKKAGISMLTRASRIEGIPSRRPCARPPSNSEVARESPPKRSRPCISSG